MKNLNEMIGRRQQQILLLLILVIVAIAFAPVRHFDFVNWDDDFYVFDNPTLTGSRPVTLKEQLTTPYSGYMAPVMILTYQVEHHFFGMNPTVFHTTNLVLHLLCCLLVYAVGGALGLRKGAALLATLLFGIHPVVSESVCWITGRKDLLVTLFSLISLQLFLRISPAARKFSMFWPLLAFTIAMFTKPIAVALIPVIGCILYNRCKAQLITRQQAILTILPFVLIALPVVVIAFFGQQSLGAIPNTASTSLWLRTLWYALGFHLGLLALLHPFCAKYVPEYHNPAFTATVDLLPFFFVTGCIIVGRLLKGCKQHFVFVIGLLYAAAFYLPNSGIIPLARFIADSFCYSLLPGLAWAMAAGFEALTEQLPRQNLKNASLVGFAAALLLLAPTTRLETAKWRNGITLWQQAERVNPLSPQICRNLGNAYFQALQLTQAKQQYLKCAAAFKDLVYVQKNLAITLVGLKEFTEAARLFNDLYAKDPNDPVTKKYLQFLQQQ